MFNGVDILESKQEEFSAEKNIQEMFKTASQLILKDSLSDHEFTLCSNTIMITIEYLESKRWIGRE